MSRYGGWAPYVPVAERRRKALREMEKLRKKGQAVSPVVLDGRLIATTFWGKAWCANLEGYQDYENRLPRGRTYVRNGSVVDLQIASKEVRAMVSGSSIYQVKISISGLPQSVWQAICAECSGGIDSLVELLQGRFNKGVMDRLCRQDNGLFPKPSEIKFSCSCPDYASMCKHIAAVLYGVGSRLDERPELLFLLRDVDHNDLLAHVDMAVPLTKQGPDAGKLLETDDLSQLFGLEMAEVDLGSAGDKALPAERSGSPVSRVPKRLPTGKSVQEKEAVIARKVESQVVTRAGGVEELYSKMQSLAVAAGFESIEEFLAVQRTGRFGNNAARKSSKQPSQNTPYQTSTNRTVRQQALSRYKPDPHQLTAKYQNPSNHEQTWSGKGRKPTWVVMHVKEGGRLEELEVSNTPTNKSDCQQVSKRNQSRSLQLQTEIKYRNPLDPQRTWSGRGRKPLWVVAHLDSGGQLADLEIG
jgi:uncharacterized Zn finger protein